MGENIIEDDDYVMYYLGKTKGQLGVGFLVKKKYKANITTFIGISDRVCLLEITLEKHLFAIIQAHAPTEGSSQEDIDIFYDDLAKAHAPISTDNIISMGDFKAQIGKPKQYEHSVTGQYGYGARSTRGERLIQYAYENNLKITNTIFNLKKHRRWTWKSPDKNTKNEIDYIMAASNN
ncbi:craniofacial development protein 2-like [Vanessa tameamea]|uniref:Craniofacial development protein 2-like n=1 Tax=Vanessa tameamea TaxID=334116 RepID=A0A8B8IRS3_VANTA|nr:craniofacial development protein 2-like [Vanessa tameamea]